MSWLKDRVKEMSTWSGASLIAFGLLIVLEDQEVCRTGCLCCHCVVLLFQL